MDHEEQKESLQNQIKERKQLFKTLKANLLKIQLPKEPIKITDAETVINCKKFVEVQISVIEANIESDICIPYLLRLIKFAEII